MNSSLFSACLRYFDNKIETQEERKILLLMNHCGTHGSTDTLPMFQNIEVEFLPPNMTSKLQPLDVGIIAATKV